MYINLFLSWRLLLLLSLSAVFHFALGKSFSFLINFVAGHNSQDSFPEDYLTFTVLCFSLRSTCRSWLHTSCSGENERRVLCRYWMVLTSLALAVWPLALYFAKCFLIPYDRIRLHFKWASDGLSMLRASVGWLNPTAFVQGNRWQVA